MSDSNRKSSASRRLATAREILDAWAEGLASAADDREIFALSMLTLQLLWALLNPSSPHRGRPADAGTLPRRVQLALVAEWIYQGRLPLDLVPQNLRLRDRQYGTKLDAERAVLQCKGKRGRSDEAAGKILNASESTVRKARRGVFKRRDGWETLLQAALPVIDE